MSLPEFKADATAAGEHFTFPYTVCGPLLLSELKLNASRSRLLLGLLVPEALINIIAYLSNAYLSNA
jgi:hypothetical protein